MNSLPISERPHYVYRCFDDGGRLLYIGSAYRVADRMHYHRIRSSQSPVSHFLRHHMATYTATEHPTRSTAEAAERAAIAAEAPLLNRLHNKGRGLDPEFYLWLNADDQRAYLASLPKPSDVHNPMSTPAEAVAS